MSEYKEEAINEANSIDDIIKHTLSEKNNFRVEAGAGSGKTYSLMKVIEWLQDNKSNEYKHFGKKVACLTFTNAAVDVIQSRLMENSFITPSTIHTFAWNAIKQFQETIKNIMNANQLLPEDCDIENLKKINYTLGSKYFDEEEETLFLGHNDILKIFSLMLDNQKFRNILYNQYPIILIDEYQDSNKEIIDKFINFFISKETGIQFGFFGDSWQTIYATNGACGKIENDKIIEIKKTINFRSIQPIVDVLNRIRPNLPQKSALPNADGKVTVITTNNFPLSQRRTDRFFKDDLPSLYAEKYVKKIKDEFDKDKEDEQKLKVLMLTHRILAEQQGYPSLFDLLGDGLKNADDILLCYLRDTLFPLINYINQNDMIGICEILKITSYPIHSKADKTKWNNLKGAFDNLNDKTILDLLSIFKENELISFPEPILDIYNNLKAGSSDKYQEGTYEQLKDVKVSEFINAVTFISPESQFSTDHGVKGEEYESVLFVIGRGWNLYQFDKWMPMSGQQLNEHDAASFERNRNLFYVCCSRPKKNLILFITIPLDGEFKRYLEYLVGAENIIEYEDYISA